MRNRLLAALILLAALAVAAPASALAPVSLTIDVSGAEAVLAAATADPEQAGPLADAALANPAVQAMIVKMARYTPGVSPAAFRAAVIAVARGGDAKPFDLARLRKDPASTQRMIARLKAEGPAIAERVTARLRAFAPDGAPIQGRLFVLVGSDQNGWVPDPLKPNLYVDLGFHGEEVDSLVNVACHELFHVVQDDVQPDWTPVFADRPDLPAEARELHRAHAVLLNLVLEGMATYVGDPNVYASDGPHITRDRRELSRNLARADQIFSLFDTVLFRARHDPDAALDPLLAIGFGGAWDETGYYVGYRMAKIIDRYEGRDRLRALVALPPEDFVGDYVALARAHPDDHEITPLAPSSVATIAELQHLGGARP